MVFKFVAGRLRFSKQLTEVDRQVLIFVSLLNKLKIRYVIVSGYVAILFGRTRGTEDIDVFVEGMSREKFGRLFNLLKTKGYWILNTNQVDDAFDFLKSNLAIRIAKKDTVVPNFEIKFPKKELDFDAMRKRLEVIMNKKTLFVSPFEIQIPFKFWLGTEKDIEDAVHIYELFKDNLNKKLMANVSTGLKVERKMKEYGVK